MIVKRAFNYLISIVRIMKIRLNKRIKIKSLVSTKVEKNVRFRCLNNGSIYIDKEVFISRGSVIESFGGKLNISQGVFFNDNVRVISMDSIQIGKNSMLGPGVMIYDHDHAFHNPYKLIKEQGYTKKGINIEEDVWIGANSIITKGVTIGKHSVIGANSVVTKDIPEFSVAAGNPAIIIKRIDKNIY